MVKILDRYIASTVLKLTLLVLAIVLGIEFFILLIAESGDIGNGGYHFGSAIIYVLLSIPANLYQLFPMVGLIGSLMGLGLLGTHHELIIMRAAGMSIVQISRSVLKASLILLIVMFCLGEIMGPHLQALADQVKLNAESEGQATRSIHGIWIKYQRNFIHIDTVTSKDTLYNVTIFQFNANNDMEKVIKAKSATHKNHQWKLNNVAISNIDIKNVSTSHETQIPWNIKLNQRILGISVESEAAMNLKDLAEYIDYRKSNELSTERYSLAFWQRLLQPIATLIMIFLGLPFIFGPLRSVTMGVRIVTGSIVGFGFYLLNQFLGPASLVYHIPPWLGASLPVILFGLISITLIKRIR